SFLEFGVMSDAVLEGDWVIFSPAWRFAVAAGISALVMFHDFGCPLQHSDLVDVGNVFTVLFDTKLEIFVQIKSLCVYAELRHASSDVLGFDLPNQLLNLDNHELRRLQRCKTHQDIHDSVVDVVLSRGLTVALHEI